MAVLNLGCVLFASAMLKWGLTSRWAAVTLAIANATIVALGSGWLGPFVVTPVAALASAVIFILFVRRVDRWLLIGVWALATVVPFAVELWRIFPPAYTFGEGEIILHARLLELPPGPTLAALAYVAVSFLVLLCVYVGRLRDEQRDAERRLFVQAWHLRQLFPVG
jgi:serine/threonine-protein kinase